MAGTINCNQLIPDPGQDLYINTGQYGANLVVGNATTQLLVVSPQGILSSGGTSALGVPTGTTAQRPANPVVGYIRFNTDFGVLENYTANGWFKVSPQQPSITSISGGIYNGNTSTLTITGVNFLQSNAIVNFAGANNASITSLTPIASSLTVTVPQSIYTITSGSSVSITVTNSDGATSAAYNMTVLGLPSGGTITQSGNTRIHTFTSSDTLVVPTGFSKTASALIAAGGGAGGGGTGGGGGAGGVISTTYSLSPGSYSIVVGAGASYMSASSPNSGYNGSNSTAFGYTATGGGAGANNGSPGGSGYAAVAGGSGGGGGYFPSYLNQPTGASGTPGQGNSGGNASGPYNANNDGGAGGGGAGAAGTNGYGAPGGVGISTNISGSPVYYGGGGGGGGGYTASSGGNGGGGPGIGGGGGGPSQNGTTNTGGGGGGGYSYGTPPGAPGRGGAGGSGIVIVSYTI